MGLNFHLMGAPTTHTEDLPIPKLHPLVDPQLMQR